MLSYSEGIIQNSYLLPICEREEFFWLLVNREILTFVLRLHCVLVTWPLKESEVVISCL